MLNYGYADIQTVTEQEFKENMLKQNDVAKIDKVRNKELVRIYIKPGSLNKDFYREKFSKPLSADASSKPLFEFKVSDWESYNREIDQFYKDNNIQEVAGNSGMMKGSGLVRLQIPL